MKNASILCISDQHFPYNHPDVIAFLKALKQKYKPDRVINIGDELDYHSISFHTHDPNLMSPSDELKTAINRIKPLYSLFPKMDIIESNHGSLVYRKGSHHGLPRHVLKNYRDVLGAPRGWHWHFDLTIRMSNSQLCYFHHGKAANGLQLSQAMGMCVVQGHFHEKFNIQYWANPIGLYWSLQIACLIDDSCLAYAYNKTNLKRPIVGTAVIINGHPLLQPMILNKQGRWIGKLA